LCTDGSNRRERPSSGYSFTGSCRILRRLISRSYDRSCLKIEACLCFVPRLYVVTKPIGSDTAACPPSSYYTEAGTTSFLRIMSPSRDHRPRPRKKPQSASLFADQSKAGNSISSYGRPQFVTRASVPPMQSWNVSRESCLVASFGNSINGPEYALASCTILKPGTEVAEHDMHVTEECSKTEQWGYRWSSDPLGVGEPLGSLRAVLHAGFWDTSS
jgi:hypothetical protein